MIVKMLRNPAKSLGCSLMEGSTGEVDKELGEMLVRCKLAVDVTPPEQLKTIEAVPEEPAISGVPESTPAPKRRS